MTDAAPVLRISTINPAISRPLRPCPSFENSPRPVSLWSQTKVIGDRCALLGILGGLIPPNLGWIIPSLSYAPSFRRDGVRMRERFSVSQSKWTVPEQSGCEPVCRSVRRRRYRGFPSGRSTLVSVSGSTSMESLTLMPMRLMVQTASTSPFPKSSWM